MARIQAWAAGCFLLVGAGLATFSPRKAQSQAPQSVLVTNTTSQPVPVSKSGTWNVGISGIPTVKLDATINTVKLDATANTVKSAQSGAWNVGLTSAGNTVRVGNAKTSPVPMYDVRDAQTPFQARLGSGTWIVVPSGKRLVIEYIGIYASGDENTGFYAPRLRTITGGLNVAHNLSLDFTRAVAGYSFFQSGQVTRMYADPDSTVYFSINGWGGDPNRYYGEATLSGYLVPYP